MSSALRDRVAASMMRQQAAQSRPQDYEANYNALQQRIEDREMVLGPGSVPGWNEGENVPGRNTMPGAIQKNIETGTSDYGGSDTDLLRRWDTLDDLRNDGTILGGWRA